MPEFGDGAGSPVGFRVRPSPGGRTSRFQAPWRSAGASVATHTIGGALDRASDRSRTPLPRTT